MIISRNVKTFHAAIDPKLVRDKKNFLIKLRINFPDLPINKIEKKLDKKKYFRIKQRINQKEKDKFWSLEKKQSDLNLSKQECILTEIYSVI